MISFSRLLSDVQHFIVNNAKIVFLTLFILALISQLMMNLFYPKPESLGEFYDVFNNMISQNKNTTVNEIVTYVNSLSLDKKKLLISTVLNYVAKVLLITLAFNVLNSSVIVATIGAIANHQYNAKNYLNTMMNAITKIIIFVLLSMFLLIFITLFISMLVPIAVPMSVIFMLGYLLTNFVFLALLIEYDSNINFKLLLKKMFAFIKSQYRLILAIYSLWILLFYLLKIISASFANSNMLFNVVIAMLDAFIFFSMICYLYRLYILTTKTDVTS